MLNSIIKKTALLNQYQRSLISNFTFNAKYLSEFALQLFFPAQCMACDTTVDKMGVICSDCFVQMQLLQPPECSQCGEPFAFTIDFAFEMGAGVLCDACATHPPLYDCAVALWAYDDLSGRIIKRFKFGDKTAFAPHLSRLLASRGEHLIANADIIAPVPLHFKRLRERRYNQAAMLSAYICKHNASADKLKQDLLLRTRYTTPQTELPFTQRQENVRGVFRVNPKYARQLEGRKILLIDDVLTTGATLNACATVLKAEGAAKICVLTLTKRLLNNEY